MSIKYLQRTNSWKEHEELHKLFCKCLIKYLQRTNSWEEVLFLLVSFEVPAADQLMENTMATYPILQFRGVAKLVNIPSLEKEGISKTFFDLIRRLRH